ncbi:hypothetical protein SAMN02800692_1853 [Luteibacter sp. UNC138MFCol5.1]|uniref:hypothetical protein n=1 Tax=Luteibacter sp. UNC138MFCol5.1 TaxID=1502774 RepID=UPI0008AC39A6|nr:hypothetical protein [Luteibacter sp. UNC138MFCol5.1]SEO74367.1 hypothetical protein SAMN02800692_1853 [Luteibacter sp. UNC138MFCol5.1]
MPKLSEVSTPQTGKLRLSDVQAPVPPATPDRSLASTIGDALAQGYRDVNSFGNELGDAFAHHVANIPVGVGQLYMHAVKGVNDAVRGEQEGDWVGRQTAAYDNWVRDREQAYQDAVPNSAGSYAGAALGEVLPWATGLGEARALGLLPTAAKTAGKLGLLGGEGALMSAAQPVTSGSDGYAGEKAKQVGVGAATGPLLYGIGAGASSVGRGVKNIAEHVLNPQAVADANIARLYGADDATLQRLANAPELVPGEVPSAAQVLQTPEAVQAERMLRNNPASAPAFVAQDNANNATRLGLLQQAAGSDDELAAAVQARRDATAPYFKEYLSPSNPEQRYKTAVGILGDIKGETFRPDYDALQEAKAIASKVAKGTLDEGQGADLLNQISVKTKKAQKVLDQAITAINQNMVDPSRIAKQLQELTKSGNPTVAGAARQHLDLIARNQDGTGMVPARALDDMRQNIGNMLSANATNGVVGSQEAALYGPVTAKIVSTLDRAIPGYRSNLETYAKLSQPINDMQAVRGLLDPNAPGSLNTGGDPQLAVARVKQALRSDDRANYGLSDPARQQLENVRDSLLRRGISDQKIAAAGPGTAADMQAQGLLSGAIFGRTLGNRGGWLGRSVGSGLGGLLGSSVGGIEGGLLGSSIGLGLSDAIGAANNRVVAKTGQAAADAKATAEAIQRWLGRQPTKGDGGLLGYYLYGLPAATQTP